MHPSLFKPNAFFSVTMSSRSPCYVRHTLCPLAPRECPIRGRSDPVAMCEAATYSVTVGRSVTLLSSFLYFILPPKGQWLTLSPGQMTHQWHHSSAALESLALAAVPPIHPPWNRAAAPTGFPYRCVCVCAHVGVKAKMRENAPLCVQCPAKLHYKSLPQAK